MKQCLLQKRDRQLVAWVPASFAIAGHFLNLRGEDGWEVVKVYAFFQKDVRRPHGYFAGGVSHQ